MIKHLLYFYLFFFSIVLHAQEWKTDYKNALALSKETQKPIILVFAGSDWCVPCIKLDREIWQSDEFKTHAKENYVLYKADFPRKKANRLSKEKEEKNNRLAEMFNPKGHFPLVVIIDNEQQVIGTMGYEKIPPEEYVSRINSYLK